jgi:hypothetical protein
MLSYDELLEQLKKRNKMSSSQLLEAAIKPLLTVWIRRWQFRPYPTVQSRTGHVVATSRVWQYSKFDYITLEVRAVDIL